MRITAMSYTSSRITTIFEPSTLTRGNEMTITSGIDQSVSLQQTGGSANRNVDEREYMVQLSYDEVRRIAEYAKEHFITG